MQLELIFDPDIFDILKGLLVCMINNIINLPGFTENKVYIIYIV